MPKPIGLSGPLHLFRNDHCHCLAHTIALHHWPFGQYSDRGVQIVDFGVELGKGGRQKRVWGQLGEFVVRVQGVGNTERVEAGELVVLASDYVQCSSVLLIIGKVRRWRKSIALILGKISRFCRPRTNSYLLLFPRFRISINSIWIGKSSQKLSIRLLIFLVNCYRVFLWFNFYQNWNI